MKRLLAVLAVAAMVLAACSTEDSDTTTTSEATTSEATSGDSATGDSATGDAAANADEPVIVLVTNDDGVDAPGIDALVEALDQRDDVELIVVAPAENQSGSGGKTTDGALEATDTTTASGHDATAVGGFPADAVIWALGDGDDEGGVEADLVISGTNSGQNIGPLASLSGTVGAARQAAQLGVPSLAVSQGLGEPPDFAVSVEAAMAWLDDNIDAVRAGTLGSDSITSINAPTCPTGEVQGQVEVPLAPDTGADLIAVDCGGTADPVDDVTAFVNGWIAVSELEPTGSITD